MYTASFINVAEEQEINPAEGSLRYGLRQNERCGKRIKVGRVWCATANFQRNATFHRIHDCLSPWKNNKHKQGRGQSSTPHSEVRTHSACQDPLSCCIFYEESPVAYYNIYRHLKIAKRVFLLHGSVVFPSLALDGDFYYEYVQLNHYLIQLEELI